MATSAVIVLTTPNNDDAPDVSLRRVVSALPAATIEVVYAKEAGPIVTLYLWVRGVTAEAFEETVEAEATFEDFTRLENHRAGTLFRLLWTVDSPLVECVRTHDGFPVEATGTSAAWRVTVWFESSKKATAFQRSCHARGIPISVTQLSSMAATIAEDGMGLTEAQREALTLARDQGYFDEPREITQQELASVLDISAPAVSHRLRRGYRALIDEVLIDESTT